MTAQPQGTIPVEKDGEPRKVQLWQLAIAAVGALLIVAHPLLGTRLPLPGGGLVAGLLVPALLMVAPFLRAGRPVPSVEMPAGASEGGPVPSQPALPTGDGPALGRRPLAAYLRRAHRQHVERQSTRADRWRLGVYVLVPLAAIAAFAAVGVFGAVACLGAGAIALMLLARDAAD